MHELTGFQRDCLVIIAGLKNPVGLDISAELEKYYGTDINHGRLYPNLNQLVDDGLVEKRKRDERSNIYSLTQGGRSTLQNRLNWETQAFKQ